MKIGDRVELYGVGHQGTIVGVTTLGQVVDGDCEDNEMDDPWYEVEWDNGFIGQEAEGSLRII